ncbi:DUF6286 domain-containing protein [Nonomuraea africana]|uniref:DUF6286 domain-containing protein n=1 Tax=Nonomuraea africana TaxID=46171 RepID=A0ABR9KW87_9ACTN|nr:DUF6286 domain-containing protein [Nonomuraea africana]MBE1566299.1 hypothetical protein [Nonomuraea africana]
MTTLQELLPGGATLTERDTPRRRAARVLKPARTPAGVAVAATVAAALSLTAAEVVAALLGGRLGVMPINKVASLAADTRWSHPTLLSGALVAGALGLVLLGLAVLPGRARLVALETSDPRLVIGITKSGLRRTLRTVAEDVDGVQSVRVRLRRRLIEVTVISDAERTGAMLRRTGTAVGDRLNGLGAICAGEVVVRLRRRSR